MVANFMAEVSPALRAKLEQMGGSRRYPARSYLFHAGDPSDSVLIVESGLLRIERTSEVGRTVLLELEMPGHLVGELGVIDSTPRSATVATVVDSSVRSIPAPAFRELMDADAELKDAVLRRVMLRLRELSQQLVTTSTLDATGRIASRLVRLMDMHDATNGDVEPGTPRNIPMPISQKELGDWAGLSRDGAVNGLRTLRSLGLIETSRMTVRVCDPEELRARAT